MKKSHYFGFLFIAIAVIALAALLWLRREAAVASDKAAVSAAAALAVQDTAPEETAVPENLPATVADTPSPAPTAEPTPTPEVTPVPTPDPDSPAGRAASLGLPAPPEIDINSWEYILANGYNNIAEYAPTIEKLEGQGLDVRIIESMKAFVEDARAHGLNVYLSSGYRDYAEQKYLFERKVGQVGSYEAAARIVLPPGTSEHQTGLACDITDRYYETKDRSLANTAMFQYMSQHCTEFGFVVRYPENKEDITGVMYEPWHFRYVGTEVAEYMTENDLCLEEFVSLYREIYSADNPPK